MNREKSIRETRHSPEITVCACSTSVLVLHSTIHIMKCQVGLGYTFIMPFCVAVIFTNGWGMCNSISSASAGKWCHYLKTHWPYDKFRIYNEGGKKLRKEKMRMLSKGKSRDYAMSFYVMSVLEKMVVVMCRKRTS